MLDLEKATAKRIVDALALALDGKPSSANGFSSMPYDNPAEYGNWRQDNNDATQDTLPGRALLMSYLIFCGGRIPLRGIEMQGNWLRPDIRVAGDLMKRGFLTLDESAGEFLVSRQGWAFVAETLEGLPSGGAATPSG